MKRLIFAIALIALFVTACYGHTAYVGKIISYGLDKQGHFVRIQPADGSNIVRCGVEGTNIGLGSIGETLNCLTLEHWRSVEG